MGSCCWDHLFPEPLSSECWHTAATGPGLAELRSSQMCVGTSQKGDLDLKMHPILLWTDELTDQHTKEVRRGGCS